MTATATRCAAADGTPLEPLVRRFAEALARLNPAGGRLGLAVSGGPDSMAMLLLAQAAIPGRFEVATVDHGLRPEAAGECALVQRACADRAISCTTLPVRVGSGNVQREARSARYAALAQWATSRGLEAIATAHHADDQAETLLMRLNRGSGLAGLAGVRERSVSARGAVPVLRPLLAFRRAELAGIVEMAGVPVAQDPSNGDDRFDRVRIRKALAGADWIDTSAFARSASHLADAEEALQAYGAELWARNVTQDKEGFLFVPRAPRLLRLLIAERIIRQLGGEPRGGDVARLVDRLERGEQGNVAGVLARPQQEAWVFRPEPPRG